MNLSTHKKSEVDLRVAQELKNNQDFVYQTNQKLQSLSEGIISLSIQNEKILSKFESEKKSLEIIVENLEIEVRKSFLETRMMIDEFRLRIESQVSFARECVKSIPENFVSKEVFDPILHVLTDSINISNVKIEKLYDINTLNFSFIKNNCDENINLLKKYIESKPSEIPSLEEKISERINEIRVDFSGLVKEITLLKRSCAYTEKKFESIFTTLESLKGAT